MEKLWNDSSTIPLIEDSTEDKNGVLDAKREKLEAELASIQAERDRLEAERQR